MTDVRQIQEEMRQLQQQIDERETEATRLERQLGMAQNMDPEDRHQRAKGQGGDIQASAQRGRVQEVEEEITRLRQRLASLQAQAGNQGATPPEHDPTVGAPVLAVGGMAWLEQSGGISSQLRTKPGEQGGTVCKLAPGVQMTVLYGPEDVDGHSWWRVRTTDGKEGWVPEDGLRAHVV